MSIKDDAYKFLVGFDYHTDPEVIGPYPLSAWQEAHEQSGIYEIGLGSTKRTFDPKYMGKAVRQMIRTRLRQHFIHSSNVFINSNKSKRYFTCRPILPSAFQSAAINNIEGLYLTAFKEQYIWNRRQEWMQHLTIEDLPET